MKKQILPIFVFVVLLVSMAWAVPDPVTNMNGEFVGFNSVKITWDHEGGATSFKIYRGLNLDTLRNIGTTTEHSYIDQSIDLDNEYLYFVTAVDSSGESNAPLYALTITPTTRPDKPFTTTMVSPEKRVFSFGEQVDFVVEVSSPFFGELEGLKAVLINEDYGIEKSMILDASKNRFTLSETLPSSESGEGFSTTYLIRVSGVLGSETFLESETYVFTIVPVSEIVNVDVGALAMNFILLIGPWIILLLIVSTVIVMGWKYYLKKRTQKDALNLELVEVLKERSVWKYDMLKRRITPQQYAEKERELQGKQNAILAKLGHAKKGVVISKNPFAGYTRPEIEEIGRLVKTMGVQRRKMSKDGMRAWLVGRGKQEKIAKKVAELIYKE